MSGPPPPGRSDRRADDSPGAGRASDRAGAGPPLVGRRRAHGRLAAGLFAGLGTQVGAWAVLIPELVASRGLTPAALGGALALMAATSIGALALAGPVADRIGRRPLAAALGAAALAAVTSARRVR